MRPPTSPWKLEVDASANLGFLYAANRASPAKEPLKDVMRLVKRRTRSQELPTKKPVFESGGSTETGCIHCLKPELCFSGVVTICYHTVSSVFP